MTFSVAITRVRILLALADAAAYPSEIEGALQCSGKSMSNPKEDLRPVLLVGRENCLYSVRNSTNETMQRT